MELILIGFLLYMAYDKHCETKQIESISKMDGLTYEQIDELVSKIKN